MFGIPVRFLVKGETTYHTPFGGILSLGILVFIIYYFIVSFLDLTSGTKPNVSSKTEYQPRPQVIDNVEIAI